MLGGRAAGSYQGRPNVFEQEEEGKERKENQVHSKQLGLQKGTRSEIYMGVADTSMTRKT